MGVRVLLARTSCFPWIRASCRAMSRVPGLGSMLRATVQFALPFGTKVWARIHSGEGKGLWLKIDPRWHKAYLEGSYEPGIQKFLREHLQPGDVFYDVGAHIGFISIIAARLVGESGSVFAFEAAPENVAALEHNVRRNALWQVHIHSVAVWSRCGKIGFRRPYPGALAGVVLDPDPGVSRAVDDLRIEVPATTLDRFVEKHLPPTLVKIDVEGAEAEVLDGAKKLFQESRPVLICEVHHQRAAMSVQESLRRNHYAFEWLTEDQPFPRHLIAQPERTTTISSVNVHAQVAS
jgi:FkbM family methyltransferase